MNPNLLLINEPRKKQPYLVNPVNPWRKITVPKHKFAVWQDNDTHRFAKPPSWAIGRKPKFGKKHKISRKTKSGHKLVMKKRITRKAHRAVSSIRSTDIKLWQKQFAGLSHFKKRIGAKKTMKHRKHVSRKHRRTTRRNPFSLSRMTKGFADTGMLIDGSLVVGGMLVTTIAMEFASSKVAFLSTPIGKGLGKMGLAFAVKTLGPKVGLKARYADMVAIGVIASAVKDVAEIILPKIGYSGGVKLLGMGSGMSAGYSPDMAGGYSPDMASGPVLEDDNYAFSDN